MTRRTALPLATAALLSLVLSACGEESTDAGDPGSTSSASASVTESDDTTGTSDAPGDGVTSEPAGVGLAAYWLADGPLGPRLAREFLTAPADGLDGAVALLQGTPDDPDYANLVGDWLVSAEEDGGEIVATVTGPAPGEESDTDAGLAVQQVVYSLQAAVGDTVGVRFVDESGADVTELGGASNPVVAADPLDTLLLVSITDPAEGLQVSGILEVNGRASSFENTVPWEVRDGDEVVLDGFATAEGDWSTGLVPWSTTVDLSGLEPGTYTFAALTDDPSGGAEGPGASEDTRTIVVG